MNTHKPHWMIAAVLVLTAGWSGNVAHAAGARDSLVRAVPADVFLCVSRQHNPEHEFLDNYWREVMDALAQANIGTDLMDLIAVHMDDAEREKFDRFKECAFDLYRSVDWEQLVSREVVFAERFPPAASQHQMIVGPPEMLLLCTLKPEQVQHNYAELTRSLTRLATEVNELAGRQVIVSRQDQLHGGAMTLFTLEGLPPEMPQMGVGVAARDNVLTLAWGPRLFEQSLALLAGESTLPAMIDDPRYQSAFAKLPAAEDSRTFFNLRALLATYRQLFQNLPQAVGHGAVSDVMLNATRSGPVNELNQKAWQAYQRGDHQHALELIQEAHKLAPQDSRVLYNLACYNILTGDRDRGLEFLHEAVAAGFYSPTHISRDSDLESVREDPRYAAALELARTRAADAATKEAAGWVTGMTAIMNRIIDAIEVIDYIASVEYTDGYTVYIEMLTVVSADARECPLFPTLSANGQPDAFMPFLPQETNSFSYSVMADLSVVYDYLLDTVREIGPHGEVILAHWDAIQEQVGFNVKRDLLSWLDGDPISVSLNDGDDWVWFLKVTDEDLAREKVSTAVQFATDKLRELAVEIPALNMLGVVPGPLADERLPGFESLRFTIVPQPIVWGVSEGHLIVASSADAVALCLDTAAGKHPGLRENPRVMAEALLPEGPVSSVSFTDLRGLGTQMSEIIGGVTMGVGMAGSFIPDPEARQVLLRLSGLMSKLVPVVQKIDFFKSTASYTTFDGNAWYTRAATHYITPPEHSSVDNAAR